MTEPRVILTDHAQLKLQVLAQHGFPVTTATVMQAVADPDSITEGYLGRKVAQKQLSTTHVLRVVYEEAPTSIIIVTVYPGRRERYEQSAL